MRLGVMVLVEVFVLRSGESLTLIDCLDKTERWRRLFAPYAAPWWRFFSLTGSTQKQKHKKKSSVSFQPQFSPQSTTLPKLLVDSVKRTFNIVFPQYLFPQSCISLVAVQTDSSSFCLVMKKILTFDAV